MSSSSEIFLKNNEKPLIPIHTDPIPDLSDKGTYTLPSKYDCGYSGGSDSVIVAKYCSISGLSIFGILIAEGNVLKV